MDYISYLISTRHKPTLAFSPIILSLNHLQLPQHNKLHVKDIFKCIFDWQEMFEFI